MTKAKYNVLMMRDNSPVKRFRMSPVWLKLGLYFLILLMACAGGRRVFRLHLLEAEPPAPGKPRRHGARAARGPHRARTPAERGQDPQVQRPRGELQALFGNVIANPSQERPTPPPPPRINLGQVFKRVDLQQVKVDNLQARQQGSKVHVTFNLNNLQTEETVSGRAEMQIITNGGKERHLQLNSNDLVFQIQRFKQISTSFALPASVPMDDVFGLRLVIKKPSGQVIFSETYPLAYIMS